MDENISRPVSDAEWYCRRDPEEERFYALFCRMCRKYDVHACTDVTGFSFLGHLHQTVSYTHLTLPTIYSV